MELNKLIADLKALEIRGTTRILISSVCIDSRKVNNGSLFVAIRGTSTDGHLFIEKAVNSGAKAVICEEWPEQCDGEVTYILVEDAANAAGMLASSFYGKPSLACQVIGVTGTNGKTSTCTLLHDLASQLGYKAGLMSTVELRIGEKVLAATHTTPDPVTVQSLLRDMVDAGCSYVFMEVSSHAVDQKRIAGIDFCGAVFTNISHDHLDYHKTFDAYIKVKKTFFDELKSRTFALVNSDDKRAEVMLQNCKSERKLRFALKQAADYKAKIMGSSIQGLQLFIDGVELYTRMIGDYNAYNLLAAYGVASELGWDKDQVLVALSALKGAEGRFDYIYDDARKIAVVVDYAHTPDAVEKVLQTAARLKESGCRLIPVLGCGGDRDKSKRPEMGKIAAKEGDLVIFTSDNPRSEEPLDILNDMYKDLETSLAAKVLIIEDRAMAIKTAIQSARPGDIIVVAGKGHEKYQEIKGTRFPFDDKKVIQDILGLSN